MPTQTLTPTQFAKDGPGLDITAILATPTQTTLQFTNSGREILLVLPTAGSLTVTIDIGVTILGQAVTNFTPVTMTSTNIYAFGPFDTAVDQSGTSIVQVVLSTTSTITVGLLQTVGTY